MIIYTGELIKMTHIPLPIDFTEKMKEANPMHSVLYIHGISLAYNSNQEGRVFLCTKETSRAFNILENDVVAAFQYWQLNRLVHLTFGEKLIIDFINFSEHKKETLKLIQTAVYKPLPEINPVPEYYEQETEDIPQKPEYTPEELEIYKNGNPAVASVFKKTEAIMGKLLKSSDLSTVFGFYEWLELPLDVIEILLDYCKANKQKNINYIEKIAIDWSEQNIKTAEVATQYIEKINKNYRAVLRAIGQSGQDNVTTSQKKYIDKWLDDYALDIEIVMAACDKTVMTTGKPTFAYVDKILTTWYNAGISTVEQIEKLDSEHKQIKKVPRKASKFNNFTATPMDHDTLESMSFELIKNASSGF